LGQFCLQRIWRFDSPDGDFVPLGVGSIYRLAHPICFYFKESRLHKGFRYLLFAFGLFLGMPLMLLLALIPRTPISLPGTIYVLSFLLIVIGLLAAPWLARHALSLILAGIFLVGAQIVIRIASPPTGSNLNIITLPDQSGPGLLNRILNEQDVVLFGAQVGPHFGLITPTEEKSLVPVLSRTFEDMYQNGGAPLSPFVTTYLNLQRPDEFDTVLAEPESVVTPRTGIIFLHGYGGNFTVQCWLIAKAGFQINAMTVCPSTSVNGQWWNPQGEQILQKTIAYLHQRGVERIYLAGLSNGGIGTSRLAEHFNKDLKGLILISGADPDATITELPVLVIHGKSDERIPVSMMEGYAAAARTNATYRLFDGDHFLLLKQADQVQEVIVDWLTVQETNLQSK
jgi:pimeloyl-ACP methyl ester carboxylesterase